MYKKQGNVYPKNVFLRDDAFPFVLPVPTHEKIVKAIVECFSGISNK